jgi:small subunit ribosomal protein S9
LSEEENTEDVTPEETPEAAAEETPAAEEVVEETTEVEVEETAEAEEVVEGEVEGAEGAGEVEVEEVATEAAEEIVAEEETEAAPAAPKSDLPPGADLEPLVEPEPEVELSAEELAAREAEEEERAAREAEEEDEDAPVAKPAPVNLAKDARFIATGKRKRSVARVIILPGDGTITINDREIDEYFPRARHRTVVNSPLVATGYESHVNIKIRVHGGGISGQAGAVRHGIARALTEVDPELRPELKRRGFLTRDARAKERRKAGLKKARKRPQFSKR